MERLQLQVIRNLELSIRNIHIVYEDRSTKPEHPFAFGITLNYITLHVKFFDSLILILNFEFFFQTTSPDWKPTILKEDTPLIHKVSFFSSNKRALNWLLKCE